MMEANWPNAHRVLVVVVAAALFAAACSSPLPGTSAPTTALPTTATADVTQDAASPTAESTDSTGSTEPAGSTESTESTDSTESASSTESAGSTGSTVDGAWDIDAALAADPNCSSPVTGDPLRIGYAADLGGLGSPGDRPGSQAATHLASLINCSGGLDGRPVEVIVVDLSGDAATTRATALDLLDQDVHALIGPPFGDLGFRLLQVTNGDVAVLFSASTEPAMADSSLLAYLVAFSDTQAATVAADFALLQSWETAVTFSSPGPYFGYHPLVFTEIFQSRGGVVQNDFDFIPLETEDFSEAIAEMSANPPDVIYSAMYANQAIALREQLDEAGLDVELLKTDAFDASGAYTLSGTDGIFHITHGFPSQDSRIVRLDESIRAAAGVSSTAPNFAALAGDSMAVIIAGYYAAGQVDDPKLIGAEIANVTNVEGVTGTLSYSGTGLPVKPIYVHEVVDGQPTLVFNTG